MRWEKIDLQTVNEYLKKYRELEIYTNWTKTTQTLGIFQKNDELKAKVRLPYHLAFDTVSGEIIESPIHNIMLVLVKAGIGSVGFFENGEISSHRVFRAYMIRKKQGKSQVKYLKTKGKSRAGSRVRLKQTLEFFEDINERINELAAKNHIDRIAISCSKTLWPYLFGGAVKPAFAQNDNRIMRTPIHVPNATHSMLIKTHSLLASCRILATPEILQEINGSTGNGVDDPVDSSDDW